MHVESRTSTATRFGLGQSIYRVYITPYDSYHDQTSNVTCPYMYHPLLTPLAWVCRSKMGGTINFVLLINHLNFLYEQT